MEQPVSKQEYMNYIIAAADEAWDNLEASRKKWYESIDLNYVFGYNPPPNELYLAALCVNIYEINKDEKYLDRAKSLLQYYDKYRDAYPDDFYKTKAEYSNGLPVLPNIFSFGKYVHAYYKLKKYNRLTEKEDAELREDIAHSADYLINFQEWGAMNRAMLRAEAMLYAAKALPDHPNQPKWHTLGQAIINDNWGQWEIEDASGYNAIWLYSLLGYASHVKEDESLYRTPIMNYYFEYFLQLMSPAGIIPDFGDANWGHSWNRYLPFFEKGAAVYNDPRLRWAAAQYFRKYLDPIPERKSVFTALCLSDAYLWADFDLGAERPTGGSREVLEDMIGKKVIFRNGWQPNSTYLLYNYRDEGDGGWLYREYLRTSIPVEEEKMHHGHADENSVVLLMKNNSVLLHDGGYRDYMPSGPYGQFRADYFHNRIAVRDGKIALGQREGQYRYASPNREAVPGQSMLDFFRNSGAYRPVRTQKIDFLELKHFDMTRTRIIDDNLGYQSDRIITYVKELDWFVIFDVVKFTKDTYLTLANLWHTRQIHAQGPGWYVTSYDSLNNVDVAGDEHLLIHFPYRERLEEGVESLQRYYQQEQAIYQMIGRHGYPGDLQTFVTVLVPHGKEEDAKKLASQIEMLDVDSFPEAVGLTIKSGEKKYVIAAKLDLQAEIVRDWRRPKYTYDSGKTRYGDYETDAYNLFAVETADKIHYAMIGAVKIKYKDRVLHEQFPADFGLNFDGSPDQPGVGKLRYWEQEVSK
ncbi:hypothetical protein KC734_01875 [candidate division KSB1 bacterium]|nr:hypothetical protein [candidate division KSB1 bacterium]